MKISEDTLKNISLLSKLEIEKTMKEKIAAIDTNELVIISEFRSPMYLPKKPEIIAATKGSEMIDNSILTFKFIYFFNTYCS